VVFVLELHFDAPIQQQEDVEEIPIGRTTRLYCAPVQGRRELLASETLARETGPLHRQVTSMAGIIPENIKLKPKNDIPSPQAQG
jgi:hypothetical protein